MKKKISAIKSRLILICMICAPFLQIQAQPNYSFEGKVVSESGKPISNANILVAGSNLGVSSDSEGKFVLENLHGKNINLTISHVGYNTLNIDLNPVEDSGKYLILKEKDYKLSEVVVTGTMTQKKLKDTPVRTEVISKEEIRNLGFMKLKDALAQQTGLTLINDAHGTGIQVQGLSSDYTLILIDGEPAIGRTAGILELSRFDVANLEQIEIVKGPSSSLYGSEALAGVINLITEVPSKPLEVNLKSTYGTYNTINAAGSAQFIHKNLSGTLYFGFNSSNGYKLNPESISQTAPLYKTYTINPKLEYKLNENSSIELSWRVFFEDQENIVQINEDDQNILLDENNSLTDWNGLISYKNNFSSFKTTAKFYVTRYFSENALNYKKHQGQTYSSAKFDQFLYKGDIYSNYVFGGENLSTFGAGFQIGTVEANYILNGFRKNNSYYVFLQHEWIPSDIFDLVAGARFDNPKDYASRLSPKVSVMITPLNSFSIRASVGSGYKAPNLEQLYLNFTNPQVGYTVFGSANAGALFENLQREGQISKVLINPEQINLKAENSIAFNLGFDYSPYEFLSVSVNLFRNNVQDLIEAAPIAIKENGQSVFTYFNLNKIYTQGVESELTINPFNDLSISAGYQFLEAKDVDIVDKIEDGEISTVTPSGSVKKLTLSNYGGLFNRSRNSGTLKINYNNKQFGLNANITGIIRGKYGFGDVNGNGVLDDEREYIQGYAVWNLTLTKSITKNINAQIRIENMFDKSNHEFIPSLPGRIFYASLSYGFSNY